MFASCEVTPKPEKETARPWKVSWIECSFLRPTPSSTQPIAEVTKVRIEEWQPTDGSDDESGSEIWQDPAAYGHRAPHYEKIRPAGVYCNYGSCSHTVLVSPGSGTGG
mmetsp:Transcript_150734/g.420191  ORF Transcript_150734/g.420191 Transcript_150734/m.420191 type:complete len:108 (+) Transcript_150734:65-388(+)